MVAVQAGRAVEARNRTNLFIAATLFTGGGSGLPVRIRNLSPGGAMVEAPVLPGSGATIRLARGALHIGGAVVWVGDKRCGLAFEGSVAVKEWMSAPANREQQRVDEALWRVRSGSASLAESPAAAPTRLSPADLAIVAELIQQLGTSLAADEDMLNRHTLQLQKIDIAVQMLGVAGDALQDGPDSARRLRDLRASAEQALRSPAG